MSKDLLLFPHIQQFLGQHSGLSEGVFTQLYSDQINRILNYVHYRIGPGEAEDVTAIIFTQVWNQRKKYDPHRGSPEAWLWTVARNIVADQLRRRSHSTISLSEGDWPAPDDPTFEAEKHEEWRKLQVALHHLDSLDQEIVALRFGSGQTNRKIALILGLSEANIAQRLRRSLQKMRCYLEGDDLQ